MESLIPNAVIARMFPLGLSLWSAGQALPISLAGIVDQPWSRFLWVIVFVGAALFTVASIALAQLRRREMSKSRSNSTHFSRKLVRSQEKERARIAGELHDGLAQELQLIRNRAELALRRPKVDTELWHHLSSISETAARAIHGVRVISRGLRPPELEKLGLSQALRDLAHRVSESFVGQFDFAVDSIDGLLKSEQELDLYRVAQEALNNALKHANATEITFEVQRTEKEIVLSVFDTGRGFEQRSSGTNLKQGSGLKHLHERAALLGGSLELNSKPQTGTRITLRVPLPPPALPLHDPRLHH